MKWKKHGLIFNPKNKFDWASSHALQPTPLFIDGKFRVFVGLRDADGVSRIGYVDLNPNNPSEVIGYSSNPVLDIGEDGAFDEFGVVPCAVYQKGREVYLYYAGYQRGLKARFLVFGGLAISNDNGENFVRYKKTPIFERTTEEFLFRVPHTVMQDGEKYRIWYGGGNRFLQGKEKTLPIYDIRYIESLDGMTIPESGVVCIPTQAGEYRLGRPYVIRMADKTYRMFYGYSSEEFHYKLGFADSADGINWIRRDSEMGLDLSESGWDSTMMAYPSFIEYKNKAFLLYNGNSYGLEGFGLAELIAW